MVAGLQAPQNGGQGVDVILRVRGTVQGVGFRPFVHRIASQLHLRGWVRNDPQGVLIRAAGTPEAVAALVQALEHEAPPAARVLAVESRAAGDSAERLADAFAIVPSETGGLAVKTAVPPDLGLCADCRRELLDPRDRRHRYPFINCTQCGPRYSILQYLPYDRPHTTMRAFRMCPQCQEEYDDPAHRRFHAQPNACPDCGPRVVFRRRGEPERAGEPALGQAVKLLAAGGILAVKGVGGYHLMADATDEAAVAELRRRKHRDEKPFAVMFRDLAAAAAAAEVPEEAAALLAAPAAPIVLLARKPGAPLAAGVAPGNPWVGALLPYAPLHVLLLEAFGRPVVATSGNLAEEPLCTAEADAHRRLARIADAFLDHNRPIAHPVDDSVVRLTRRGPVRLRRARGYAPAPLRLPGRIDGSWLCVGAQMKNTLAVATQDQLVLSPHIGDLGGAATRDVFHRTAEMLEKIHGAKFTKVVCDRHPDYASTRYAEQTGLPLIAVQHHLAHVLACLLEHGRAADGVLGVAWDGTGYGEDGTVWGGEFLLLQNQEACRFARLRPFRLPGGETAIRDGRRAALGLAHALSPARFEEVARRLEFLTMETALLHTMLQHAVNSPETTSMGRLFDAAGALLGLPARNHFEGQIPLAVEATATAGGGGTEALPLPLRDVPRGRGAVMELDWEPLLDSLLLGRTRGRPPGELAAAFHRGLAQAVVAVARAAGVGTVALSGGCFQNVLLLDLTTAALESAGFTVLVPRELPPNDGAIAAGQALGALLQLTSVRMP
ncbi:MAG TPA: carbamoyltransferase HypF [Opitutaceae bacterium]|nr:carbamoyltransferase HypF [Opitutaceae bacterium]